MVKCTLLGLLGTWGVGTSWGQDPHQVSPPGCEWRVSEGASHHHLLHSELRCHHTPLRHHPSLPEAPPLAAPQHLASPLRPPGCGDMRWLETPWLAALAAGPPRRVCPRAPWRKPSCRGEVGGRRLSLSAQQGPGHPGELAQEGRHQLPALSLPTPGRQAGAVWAGEYRGAESGGLSQVWQEGRAEGGRDIFAGDPGVLHCPCQGPAPPPPAFPGSGPDGSGEGATSPRGGVPFADGGVGGRWQSNDTPAHLCLCPRMLCLFPPGHLPSPGSHIVPSSWPQGTVRPCPGCVCYPQVTWPGHRPQVPSTVRSLCPASIQGLGATSCHLGGHGSEGHRSLSELRGRLGQAGTALVLPRRLPCPRPRLLGTVPRPGLQLHGGGVRSCGPRCEVDPGTWRPAL